MNTPRETIYAALFTLLSQAVDGLNFITISRRVRMWTEVPAEEQPALFMRQVREVAMGERGHPNKWELFVDVAVYAYAGSGPNDSGAPLINSAIDKIEALLPTNGPRVQNLRLAGVSEVRILGDVIHGEGVVSGQAVAIIPIRIVAT